MSLVNIGQLVALAWLNTAVDFEQHFPQRAVTSVRVQRPCSAPSVLCHNEYLVVFGLFCARLSYCFAIPCACTLLYPNLGMSLKRQTAHFVLLHDFDTLTLCLVYTWIFPCIKLTVANPNQAFERQSNRRHHTGLVHSPISCEEPPTPMFPLSCAVAIKIVIQRTRLFFLAALLKIGGNIGQHQSYATHWHCLHSSVILPLRHDSF